MPPVAAPTSKPFWSLSLRRERLNDRWPGLEYPWQGPQNRAEDLLVTFGHRAAGCGTDVESFLRRERLNDPWRDLKDPWQDPQNRAEDLLVTFVDRHRR